MLLESKVFEHINNMVFISGSARSGTTILGKLLHSCKNTEYFFEPPTLFSMFPLINDLPEEDWRLLYETYLYEEQFINAIAGRTLNCNRGDDSSVYNVKSEAEINARLSKSHSKDELEAVAGDYSLAIKMPDVVGYLPKLQSYYPGIKLVISTRKAPEVFVSTLNKGWFDDKSLQESRRIWPCYDFEGKRVPYWVPKSDAGQWNGLSEIDRVAYYYINVNKPMLDLKNHIQVKYESMIKDPEGTVFALCEKLGLKPTDMTRQLVASVERKREKADDSILNDISPELAEEVRYFSSVS